MLKVLDDATDSPVYTYRFPLPNIKAKVSEHSTRAFGKLHSIRWHFTISRCKSTRAVADRSLTKIWKNIQLANGFNLHGCFNGCRINKRRIPTRRAFRTSSASSDPWNFLWTW